MPILIAHQDALVGRSIASIVRSVGYEVHGPVTDESQVIVLMKETEYNLILLHAAMTKATDVAQAEDQPTLLVTGGNRFSETRDPDVNDGPIDGWFQNIPYVETPLKANRLLPIIDRYRKSVSAPINRTIGS